MCNDEPSFEFAEAIGAADRYVIAAACFTELEFVKRVARTSKPILLRIGGATLSEIDDVVTAIRNEGNSDITLLLGVQTYPTDIAQTFIASLPRIRSAFGCAVGLADHIDGALPEAITLPALALAFGATAIEKHITTAREEKLEDFEAALGIEEFGEFVKYLRTAELALGNGEIPTDSEAATRYRMVVRKRVVAARDLPAGTVLAKDDVAFKRADHGLPAEDLNRIVGKSLNGAVSQNAGLTPDMFATGQ
jgi:N,N'-diacetyllegionaminate synthase